MIPFCSYMYEYILIIYVYQNITTTGKNNVINIGMSEKKNYSLTIVNIKYTSNRFVTRTAMIFKSFNDNYPRI